MALLTDFAVRRKGETTAMRYCVMCLADDEKVEARYLIELKDGGEGKPPVEAGYCRECAQTMKKCGHTPRPIVAERKQSGKRGGVGPKLTPAQRAEIQGSEDTVKALAARYAVSLATIYNLRNKAKEQPVSGDKGAAVNSPAPKDPDASAGVTGCRPSAAPTGREFYEATAQAMIDAPRPGPEMKGPITAEPADAYDRVQGYGDDDSVPAKRGETDCFFAQEVEMPVEQAREMFPTPYEMTFSEPTSPKSFKISLEVTEAQADAVWNDLSLADKALFVRAKLLERLAAL